MKIQTAALAFLLLAFAASLLGEAGAEAGAEASRRSRKSRLGSEWGEEDGGGGGGGMEEEEEDDEEEEAQTREKKLCKWQMLLLLLLLPLHLLFFFFLLMLLLLLLLLLLVRLHVAVACVYNTSLQEKQFPHDQRHLHTSVAVNLFTVVRFRNGPCTGSDGLNGTCYTA